jgi:hypothetical protein
MDRVSAPNYATVSGLRMFQDANLGTATPGTELEQVWFNGVQESIIGAVTAAGLTPTDSDNTQLLAAIRILAIRTNANPTGATSSTVVYPGAGYSGSVSVTFTAPSAGWVTMFGKLPLNVAASAPLTATLALNGGSQDFGASTMPQLQIASAMVTAGEVVTVSFTVTTVADPVIANLQYRVVSLFTPSA